MEDTVFENLCYDNITSPI